MGKLPLHKQEIHTAYIGFRIPPFYVPEMFGDRWLLLVAGAGLSAADAILHALGFEDVRVTHVFFGRRKFANLKLPRMKFILQRNKSHINSTFGWI